MIEEPKEGLAAIAPHMGDMKIAPAVGIGAIALEMAMKYHNINHVHDGQLYQQYKLEGRNMADLSLEWVFDTAIKIEQHLLATSERIAGIVIDALEVGMEEDDAEHGAPETEQTK